MKVDGKEYTTLNWSKETWSDPMTYRTGNKERNMLEVEQCTK